MTPRTLGEAQAQCRAMGVDLRKLAGAPGPVLVGGAPMRVSECADLILPFCPGGGVRADQASELPRCVNESVSPAKAAALLAEAHDRQAALAGPPWLLIGAGVLAAGLAVYFVAR